MLHRAEGAEPRRRPLSSLQDSLANAMSSVSAGMVHLVLFGVFMTGFYEYINSRNYKSESRINKVVSAPFPSASRVAPSLRSTKLTASRPVRRIWVVCVLSSMMTIQVVYQVFYHGVCQVSPLLPHPLPVARG